MPNGSDCCCLLQTEPHCVPTRWLVFDVTDDRSAATWFRRDINNTIDYVWLRELVPIESTDRSESLKQAVIHLRPAALKAMFDTHPQHLVSGQRNRLVIWVIGDLSSPLSRLLLAELPLDLSNAMFWQSNFAPGVIRAGIGKDSADRRAYLSIVREQYFDRPSLDVPYFGGHEPGQLYGNAFDSSLLAPDHQSLGRVIEQLVPLHIEETSFALEHTEPDRTSRGQLIIEDAMAGSLRWRKIDWLALAMYPHFARLWDTDKEDILDVLDYGRCPTRVKDPWAAVKDRSRESDWSHLALEEEDHNLMYLEEPYRITPGDVETRLRLAGFLCKHKQHEEVIEQARRARDEAQAKLPAMWQKVEGLSRHGLGQEEDAQELFREYREALLAEPSPTAATFDEVSCIALMQQDWEGAVDNALRAIEEDSHLLRAYDTLVIVARQIGRPQYEDQAKALAEKNDVTISLLTQQAMQEAISHAKIAQTTELQVGRQTKRKWWKFWGR